MKTFKELMSEGKKNDREMPNSNMYLSAFGRDVNGNSIVKFNFAGSKGSSIQINGPEFKETKNLNHNKLKELSDNDLVKIEKEIVAYITKYGTKGQKTNLKTY